MKLTKFNFLTFIIFCLIVGVSCDEKSNSEKAAKNVEVPSEAISDAFKSNREKLQIEVQEARDEIADKITELQNKLEKSTPEEQTEINQELTQLDSLMKTINADMKKLGENIADSWDEFKENNEWEKFSDAVKLRLDKIDQAMAKEDSK